METTPAKSHGDMLLREISGEIVTADKHVRRLLDDYKAALQAVGHGYTGTMPYEVAAYLIEQGWTPAK